MRSVAGLADLGMYQLHIRPSIQLEPVPTPTETDAEIPIEFFDDPGHAPDCPLR